MKNGFINKQSVKAAVADVLIQSGGRQRFELDVAKYLNVLDESPVEAITEVVFVEGFALREDGKTLRVNLDESPVEAITEVVFVEGIALREDGKTLRVNLGT